MMPPIETLDHVGEQLADVLAKNGLNLRDSALVVLNLGVSVAHVQHPVERALLAEWLRRCADTLEQPQRTDPDPQRIN
jgi:hypothetical protein